MPGLSFISSLSGDLVRWKQRISTALDSLIYFPEYKSHVLIDENRYFLACTKYQEYPFTRFENDDFVIYLEGKIYGISATSLLHELQKIAQLLFHPLSDTNEYVGQWLLRTDGDFVIFMLNKKTNSICILNDAMNHLPLYYYQSPTHVIISREMGFILKLIDNITFDRMAIAHNLLFCHTLGKGTLFDKIYRFEPATMMRINPSGSHFSVSSFDHFNFDKKEYSGKSIQENADTLACLFIEACKNRAKLSNGSQNILSLSGGLDSRTVAAALNREKIHFTGTTFLNHDHNTESQSMIARQASADIMIAEQISRFLGNDLKVFYLPPPKGEDYKKLLRMKHGLNYLAMSFILPYLNQIRETYGPKIIYFTGDMGLVTFKNNKPTRRLKTISELVNYILYKNSVFTIDDVAKITNLGSSEIFNSLRTHVESYPEQSLSQKYAHFQIYERSINWGFEGIDRNRYYFWQESPLLSTIVVHYSLNCPDQQKSPYKLYKYFMSHISKEVAGIKYADYGLPVTSKKFVMKHFISSFYNNKIPTNLKHIIRKHMLRHWDLYEKDTIVVKCIHEQLDNCLSIGQYLSIPDVKSTIATSNQYQFNTLLTITSVIEEALCSSTLDKYSHLSFN